MQLHSAQEAWEEGNDLGGNTTSFTAHQAKYAANQANLSDKGCHLILIQIKLAAAEGRYQVTLQLTNHQVHWLEQQSYIVTKAGADIYNINWN